MERRVRENPLRYFRPHAKQREFMEADRTLRAFLGGNRTGKSQVGGAEVARIVLGEHPFIAPSSGWSWCPSFDVQKETTQAKLLQYIPDHRIDWDRTVWLRKGILRELVVRDATGTPHSVTFKSYEQGRDKAQGAGLGWQWFDEEPPKDVFTEASVRSEAGVPLYLFLTMTPVKGMTWVYTDIYLRTDNPDQYIVTATWEDNPYLDEDQKKKMAARLSQAELKVRREGKFMRQVGLVASWFDRNVHVADIDEVPEGDFHMGVDFGFSNPACALWASLDANDNLWVFDGFYGTGMTNPDILEKCKRKEKLLEGYRIERVGDSAQASDIKELNDAGYRIEGVHKESGTSHQNWDEWRAKLMEDYGRVTEDSPHPRIIISSSLVAYDEEGQPFNFLVRELENLRWEEVTVDGVTKPKSQWGRQPNHGIDALSYILATIERNQRRGLGRRVAATASNPIQYSEEHGAKKMIETIRKANRAPARTYDDDV